MVVSFSLVQTLKDRGDSEDSPIVSECPFLPV